MSVIGIRMMNAPRVDFDPAAPSSAAAGAAAPDFGRTGSVADFEAGMQQAARDAVASDGPPLWNIDELARALARRAEPGGPGDAPLGNPQPPRSEAWLEYGEETGIWFRLEASWFQDLDRALQEAEDASPFFRFDPRGTRKAWHDFVEDYARQLGRLSDLMSRAVRAGASEAQLRALYESATERGAIGEGEKSDFEEAWKNPQSDLRLGNIYGGGSMVLGGRKDHILKPGARQRLRQMGDQAVDALERQAKEMGLDLYESDDRKAERVSASLGLYFQQHQLELAHLHGRDPAAWAWLHELRRELVAEVEEGDFETLSEDPEAAMRRADARSSSG